MQESRFNWQQLGQPDYAESAAIVASLPGTIRRRFGGHDERILTKVFFLCWSQAFHSGRGSAFAQPGHLYLGAEIQRSRWTVARVLRSLGRANLILSHRRRPVQGRPLTNWYTLGKACLSALYARFNAKVQQKRDVAKMPHNNLKKRLEPWQRKAARDSVTQLETTRGLERRAFSSAQAPAPLSEEKRQAELLKGREILRKMGLRA